MNTGTSFTLAAVAALALAGVAHVAGSAARTPGVAPLRRIRGADGRPRRMEVRSSRAIVYPFSVPGSGLSARYPFVPEGPSTVERATGGPFGSTRTIYVLHPGRPVGTSSRDPLPNTLVEAWVERADGRYVASESWVGDYTYFTPPTRAEFDAAWTKGRLPPRGTRPASPSGPRRLRRAR